MSSSASISPRRAPFVLDPNSRYCDFSVRKSVVSEGTEALRERHDYFSERRAKASDHGLLEPYALEVTEKRAKEIFHDAYERKVKFGIR